MSKLAELAHRPDFQFGPLLVSAPRRLVVGPGGEVHLEPLVMQVLLRLLDADGAVVTRDELFAECWGGIHVGDNSLNRVVASVRRALEKTAPGRFDLETIPRTGYRVVGDILPGDQDPPESAPERIQPRMGRRRSLTSSEASPSGTDLRSWSASARAHRWPLATGVAIAFAGLALVLFSPRLGEERKPVLAVFPFRAVDAQSTSLVAGIWEDTRQAIGRNPQIVVLGPNSSQTAAAGGEQAARRVADYLLEASVRTAGDRVRISTELVRTADGEQLWSHDFDGSLSDVFALQTEIANEIEGHIRGRLAEKGGVRPEHISTSRDVYVLYSDARAKVRTGRQLLVTSAYAELGQVVRADPNFAPGWAELAEAGWTLWPSERNRQIADHLEEYARRAIDLAPNLATGHAALAVALYLDGPIARAEIERAVQLDPNDFEAWTWLGNSRLHVGDTKGALDAYAHAAAIEPLFSPAMENKYLVLKRLGDRAGIAQLLEQEKRLGADDLATLIEVDQAYSDGHPAQAANLALAYWASGNVQGRTVIQQSAFDALMQLGFVDEAIKAENRDAPDFAPYLLRDQSRGLDMFESHHIGARTLFEAPSLTEIVARAYVLNGRSTKLANDYLSLRLSPEQVAGLPLKHPESILYRGPVLVVALRNAGHPKEAADLLAYTRARAADAAEDGSALNLALLARVDAVDGRKEEALALLTRAVDRGWIPAAPLIPVDLHRDPALAPLAGDAQFELVRNRILATMARERAKVDPTLLRKFEA